MSLGDVVPQPAAPGGHYDALDASAHTKPKRDIKKLALIVGLSVLAWVSTYTGMLELIQANLGEIGLVERVATGLAVAMLQIMIVWLLDQLFSPIHASIKAFYIVGYMFLTLISVGFAFGFYWKVLESRSATTSSAESSIGAVQSALRGAETRLDQLVSTLEALTTISTQKAEQEAANGNSCPGSKPGAGPRMAMRRGDAEKFSFGSNFVKGRSEQVKSDIKTLDVDLQRILKDDKSIVDAKSGTRNEFLKGMSRKLEETTSRYNALRTDAQLRQIRQDAAERAEKTTFPDSKGGIYACPDGQLQSALRGVVGAIDQLPPLDKPKIAATEGSEAVIEAFRRLTMTLAGALQFKLPPTPEELREKQTKAVQTMENPAAALAAQKAVNLESAGLGKRDYIPLGIAIFVDFCLLMVSFGRPANRFAKTAMELRAAELGPQSAIVGINREVHEDPIIRRNFELFQHVVIHFGNHYLAAVPLTAPRQTPDGKDLSPEEREKLQIEAQTLVTLFSGLELNSSIVDRGLPPILLLLGGARLVRRRLLKQESKFARAGAFRFYRFRNRAWPEMILGTVMGTAKKYEADLREKRVEEAAHEKEQRRLETEERKAAIAQRKAENAQKIAEAELRTMEAQSRQRTIEDELRRKQQASLNPSHYPSRPRLHDAIDRSMGGYDQSLRGAPHAPGPVEHPHAAGPGGFPQPMLGYGAPREGQPSHVMPHYANRPPQIPQNDVYPPPSIQAPANHNTAPVDRARNLPQLALGLPEMRSLPDNVVAMPERFDRTQAVDAPSAPTGNAQAMSSGQGASVQAQAASGGATALTTALAQAMLSTNAVSFPPAVAAAPAPVSRMTSEAMPMDLRDMLKGVAVRQMGVAREVAAVVHEMESSLFDARAPSQLENRPVVRGEVSQQAALAHIEHQAALPAHITPLAEATPSREQQAWREVTPTVHDDMKRAFAGRGLATDPGLDDAGSIAARYAPATPYPR